MITNLKKKYQTKYTKDMNFTKAFLTASRI